MLVANAIGPALRAGATYDSTILADSPVAFWKLNETSGTSAVDATGNGNTGTYTGTTTLNQTGIGDGEGAVLLDGSTGYVSVASASGLHPAHPTAEVWVFPTGTNDGAGFLCSNAFTSNVGYELGNDPVLNSRGTGFGSYNGTWHAADLASALTLNAWHHVVGTYDGSTMTLYIDGSSVATLSASFTVGYDSNEFRIGRRHDGSSAPFFHGRVAKAAVYNYALTSTQVSNHFSASSLSGGATLAVPSATGVAPAVMRASVI